MDFSEIIQVTLAFDENYVAQFYALATSIFLNNKMERLSFHAITSGVSPAMKLQISQYVKENGSDIQFYSVPDGFANDFPTHGNWTAATYYRLLLPDLLPDQVAKYIYIDTDTLVIGDLGLLWRLPIGDAVVGAVRDKLVEARPDLGISRSDGYFNAGVLLVNRRKWEDENVSERAIEFLSQNPDKTHYADQDALNFLFNGKWFPLDPRFNLMYSEIPGSLPRYRYKEFLKDKVIIHFTQHRPWNMLCRNPFRFLYHKYLNLSPFRGENKYVDYSSDKLIQYIKIRMTEFYLNAPALQKSWRFFKMLGK